MDDLQKFELAARFLMALDELRRWEAFNIIYDSPGDKLAENIEFVSREYNVSDDELEVLLEVRKDIDYKDIDKIIYEAHHNA